MSYRVRLARLTDADRINVITRDALGYPCAPEQTRAQLSRVLASPGNRVFIVCDDADDSAAGFLHAANYETLHAGSMKSIVSLAVDGAYRGLGLGRMLLAAVECWAREEHCEAVRLVSAEHRKEAHAFYEHCGYHLRKVQKNYIKHL